MAGQTTPVAEHLAKGEQACLIAMTHLHRARGAGERQAVFDADLRGGSIGLGREAGHRGFIGKAVGSEQARYRVEDPRRCRAVDEQVVQIADNRSHLRFRPVMQREMAEQLDAVRRLADKAENRCGLVDRAELAGDAVRGGDQVIGEADASDRLPLMVIVPGEAPGDSVPATLMLPLTVPALPKVPRAPTLKVVPVSVLPAPPIRRSPLIVKKSNASAPLTRPTPVSRISVLKPEKLPKVSQQYPTLPCRPVGKS